MTQRNDLPDFKDLSLEELQEAKERAEKLIARQLESKKRQALNQIKELVQQYELSYDEVVKVIRTTAKRGKAPAIYRNPENPRQTWSGQGTAPGWFEAAENKEALRIPGA